MTVKSDPVSIENLKGSIELAKEGLKALHLANGGAVVALLTFYGGIAAQNKTALISAVPLACALKLFAWGLAASLFASILAYLSQLTVATEEKPRREIVLRCLALIAVVVSLLCFVGGVYEAADSFRGDRPAVTSVRQDAHLPVAIQPTAAGPAR